MAKIRNLSNMAFVSALVLLFVGCGKKLFKERATETPPPSEQIIEKSFFVDPKGKPKTFLCGWAPEIGRGAIGEKEILRLVESQAHCNIEFQITEDFLIGKMIHPSFPNDRNRWKEALKIPISKHFYYEPETDGHGRKTNRMIENDGRSHWSARPYIKLQLASSDIHQLFPYGSHTITSVEDIDWDRGNGFLGFSINTVSALGNGPMRAEYQAKFRVNFLKFEHDTQFKKVPYHNENSKYFNALHVFGRKIEGTAQELYVARWDVSKPTKLYISGANPSEAKILVAAVEKWNTAFREWEIVPKGGAVFEPVVQDLKHPFDLRYPSIIWIGEKTIPDSNPLGVGMAHADVRNGKILWGSATLFGGPLQEYISAYSPIEGTATQAGSTASILQSVFPSQSAVLQKFQVPQFLTTPEKLDVSGKILSNLENLNGLDKANINNSLVNSLSAEQAKKLAHAISRDSLKIAQEQMSQLNYSVGSRRLGAFIGFSGPQEALAKTQQNALKSYVKESDQEDFENIFSAEARTGQLGIKLKQFMPSGSAAFVENEWNLQNLAPQYGQSAARKTRSYQEILESVITDLALHEVGHVLGLGHQFKENIMPNPNKVPATIYADLLKHKNKDLTNSTTVMGYRDGKIAMIIPTDEMKPGPHDQLVITYLYKGQYAAFQKSAQKFKFIDVPKTGRIPGATQVKDQILETSYFPACNDIDASFDLDPFCNRWDKGSTAEEIVSSYFERITDNLVSNLYSLVGGRGNSEYAEYRLWINSLKTFSRVRLFYDEMRRRLRTDERFVAAWDRLRTDEKALHEFAKGCDDDNTQGVTHPDVLSILKYPEMMDLCRANALALEEFSFFLSLPEGDFTKKDFENRFATGGLLTGDIDDSYGHIFGSWYQLANFPLKYSALYTLTTARPYFVYGEVGVVDNFIYNHEQDKYLYRTLYPRQYTQLISTAVTRNLRFGVDGRNDTTLMGKSVLAAGLMVPFQTSSTNDSALLPDAYNRTLNRQTQFTSSLVAVLIDVAPQQSGDARLKTDYYRSFTAKIFDYMNGREIPTNNFFILPNGDVIVTANNMFIYPLTSIRFWDDKKAYVLAYKVDYDLENQRNDPLFEISVKNKLTDLHLSISRTCIDGEFGLSSYFSNADLFDGFHILSAMSEDPNQAKLNEFFASIDKEFEKYQKLVDTKVAKNGIVNTKMPPTMRAVCTEANRGLGLILSSAALLGGDWLGITAPYLVH